MWPRPRGSVKREGERAKVISRDDQLLQREQLRRHCAPRGAGERFDEERKGEEGSPRRRTPAGNVGGK